MSKVGKATFTGIVFAMIMMFQVATGFAVVIVTGVLDTVMINELGVPALLVGFLLGVDFIAQPFRAYFGSLSDRFSVGGLHRLPFIFLAGTIMCLTYPALILVVEQLRNPTFTRSLGEASNVTNYAINPFWFGVAIIVFTINGIGVAIMGTVGMSLLVDITSEKVRGMVGGISWVLLIFGIVVGSIVSSQLTPDTGGRTFVYSSLYPFFFYVVPTVLFVMVLLTCLGAIFKEPRRPGPIVQGRTHVKFVQALRIVSANRQCRWFFLFLFTMMTFMFMRDILAPSFAGNVYHMTVKDRAGIQSVINGPLLLAIIVAGFVSLRISKKIVCYAGLAVSVVGIGIQALAGFTFQADAKLLAAFDLASQQFASNQINQETYNVALQAWYGSISGSRGIFTIGMVIMGIGLGIAVPGLIGMMMDLTDPANAALYLGVWGLAQAFGQNLSSILAGGFRDIAFDMFRDNLGVGYGIIFVIQAAGMALALWILTVVNVSEFRATVSKRPVTASEQPQAVGAVGD
jgi:MFS transporter, BCD family, chlorophyll transporter